MISPQKLFELRYKITEELSGTSRDLLSVFPIQKYIEYIDCYPAISGYGFVGKKVNELCRNIVSTSNEHTLQLYHQLLLVDLISIADNKIRTKNFPAEIVNLFSSNFNRIALEIEAGTDIKSYTYAEDRFRKKLAVCSLRMIPAGAQKINLVRMSRRILLQHGIFQFTRALSFVLIELGGFQPLFEMHTDSNDPELMAEFNESGWLMFYRRVSELLKLRPEIKGIVGNSWFYDPQLEKISPRLTYLRKIVTENGGCLFYVGPSASAIKDATLKSPTRKKLYEEGTYIPTDYLVVWPRKQLICWSDKAK